MAALLTPMDSPPAPVCADGGEDRADGFALNDLGAEWAIELDENGFALGSIADQIRPGVHYGLVHGPVDEYEAATPFRQPDGRAVAQQPENARPLGNSALANACPVNPGRSRVLREWLRKQIESSACVRPATESTPRARCSWWYRKAGSASPHPRSTFQAGVAGSATSRLSSVATLGWISLGAAAGFAGSFAMVPANSARQR